MLGRISKERRETCGHPTGREEIEGDLTHLLTAPLDRTRERNFQQVSPFLLCSPVVLSLVFLPGLRGAAAHLDVVSLVRERHLRAGLPVAAAVSGGSCQQTFPNSLPWASLPCWMLLSNG